MRPQRLHRIGTVHSQVITVVLRCHNGIEGFIVQRRQLASAGFVLPQPFLEFLLNGFHLFIGRRSGILIYHRFTIVCLIFDNNALAVQHSVKQIQEGPAAGTPFLSVGSVGFQIFATKLHGEITSVLVPGYDYILAPIRVAPAKNMCRKVRIYAVRNPRCTWIDENFLIGNILRHNCLQCFHILLVIGVNRHHRFSVTELCTDITGKIDLGSFQFSIPVLEYRSAVNQLTGHIVHRLAGEPCDQCCIHASGLIHRNDQALCHILGSGNGSVRCNRILAENIGLRRLLGFRVPVFQRKDRKAVRIVLDGVAVGLGIDKAVLLDKGIIGFIQLLPCLFDFGFFQSLLQVVLKLSSCITDL